MVEEKIELASGLPVPDDQSHTKLKANGQQEDYIVLSAEERAKGFVRPYRSSYRHVGVRPKHPLRDLTEDEQFRYKRYDYVKYEEYPAGSNSLGRYWTAAQLASGCRTVTVMSRSISETYARNPKFYGGTFCVGCGKHFPLEEFVWEGTTDIVGS